MNNLRFAIEYMNMRVRALELECELDRYRNCDPTRHECQLTEAKNLRDVLRGFAKDG